jgi:hypothetical protein
MSNIFQEVLKDASGLEQKLLGPTYPYYKNIRTPGQIGMSDSGSLDALGRDVNGLINYIQFLVQGNSNVSTTGQPLGNKFFLKTGAKCLAKDTGKEVDRYIYVNNVPDGTIPIVSQGLGVNFSQFRGLIPGAIGNLNVLNPYTIMQSFMVGSTPSCQKITMETINNDNNRYNETQYVTLVDIQNMNPCNFRDNRNPISGKTCRQAFQNIRETPDNSNNDLEVKLPEDPIAQLYYLSLSAISVYILYRLIEKGR